MNIRMTHPQTGQPIRPLGARKDGRLIWPIMGGSEDAGSESGDAGGAGREGGDTGGDAGADSTPPPANDAGEAKFTQEQVTSMLWNRMDRETRKHQAEIRSLKEAADRAVELETELATIKTAHDTTLGALVETRRAWAIEKAAMAANVDPAKFDLVAKLVDPATITVTDDGVDTESVTAAVAKILEATPEWVRQDGKPAPVKPVGGGDRQQPPSEEAPSTLGDAISKFYQS